MSDLASNYAIPPQLMEFVNDGFLEVVREVSGEKTVEFHIPSKRDIGVDGRITSYSLTWIHPDFNERFCHYYVDRPGDSPNFFAIKDTTDVGEEQVELESVDDLVAWLSALLTPNG